MPGPVTWWLHRKDPEEAHDWALARAAWASDHGWALSLLEALRVEDPRLETTVLGMDFDNPLGLAAGFDKDGVAVPAMVALGFGFVEVGTVTPEPQEGNPKPRMWRHADEQALVNALGFPSSGRRAVAENLAGVDVDAPVWINVGPNRGTGPERAHEDVRACLETLWPRGDAFVVNVSSPNTPWLRDLEDADRLGSHLGHVLDARDDLGDAPLLVKVSPDRSQKELEQIADVVAEVGVDGVVATNTTSDRDLLPGAEEGGISGRPLTETSRRVCSVLREALPRDTALVGCGGILDGDDARRRLDIGADLIECYTALVYRGARAPARILAELLKPGGSRTSRP